ncbi:MAG: tRNA (guanosine(37)-N1)-methyltransferase TrmD [Deltaproteobacteria bacterium]|nr:tRNA (guanosine(37)-N1)-methyltransferase TrmD [Deltaproteobacteria bacterium]
MHFDVVTLLPSVVEAYLDASVLGRARKAGAFTARAVDLRPHGQGKHRQVDDAPYGGGAGMVLAAGPLVQAIEQCVEDASAPGRVGRVLMAPGGEVLDRHLAGRLARDYDHLVLVCGRFEGVDARVHEWIDLSISLGDVVLTGGELAALAVVDSVCRLLPDVLGNAASAVDESFEGPLLEYPQFTRPREFQGREVPAVLLSGDHKAIARWRLRKAVQETRIFRPERLEDRASLPKEVRELVEELDKVGAEE